MAAGCGRKPAAPETAGAEAPGFRVPPRSSAAANRKERMWLINN